MTKKTFSVPNISCDHCVKTIRNELEEIAGVERIEGDADKKRISVSYEAPATEAKLREKLKEINYPAE
ncbi:MAG: heavy-metal-associated domain-containing protein [Desulfobacterales bacterium]|nr:heavy-metal-associated domain-containing protein [Desulfobacterales bacterium]